MTWQQVFSNPRLARGRVVAAETLRVGDVISGWPYNDHHVQILEGPLAGYGTKDRFGRGLLVYKGRIIAGSSRLGDEGEMSYGPGGKVRLVRRAP